MARLLIKLPGSIPRAFVLKLGPNRLGRSPGSDLQIEHPTVSSAHCEVVLGDEAITVRDLGSTNGTFIDGQHISEAELRPGQTLNLGAVEILLETAEVEIRLPEVKFEQPTQPQFLPDGTSACVNHPKEPAAYRCTQCHQTVCNACIHLVRRVGGDATLTLCPFCSGLCEPASRRAPARIDRPSLKNISSLFRGLRKTLKIQPRRSIDK